MEETKWKVVPLSSGQLLDVRPEDVLEGGLYRKCVTYRGGGGYDKFPSILHKRCGVYLDTQFIVQLFGCVLDCPYCYVTRSGVWGAYKTVSLKEMVDAFIRSKLSIFHLMGGAPAIYLHKWKEIINVLPQGSYLHSDLMLCEGRYEKVEIESVCKPNVLIAINIKGTTDREYELNTRKKANWKLFWSNLDTIAAANSSNFYFTFTGCLEAGIESMTRAIVSRYGKCWMDDSFSIPLIDYNALPFVDSIAWGKQ